MSAEIIVCPDTHCRDFYKPVLDIKDRPIVFLGDYMDPYPTEPTSNEQGFTNLEEIIDFARNNSNVHLLVGNHDLSYIWSYLGCERTPKSWYSDLHKLYRDNIDLFKPFYLNENNLFSHGGISKGWIDTHNIEDDIKLNSYQKILLYVQVQFEKELKERDTAIVKMWDTTLDSDIFDCGYCRWGHAPYGGIFWNDVVREHTDPEWDLYQIVGHTQLSATGTYYRNGNTFLCDSRAIFEYNPKTHEIKFSDLNTDATKKEFAENSAR